MIPNTFLAERKGLGTVAAATAEAMFGPLGLTAMFVMEGVVIL